MNCLGNQGKLLVCKFILQIIVEVKKNVTGITETSVKHVKSMRERLENQYSFKLVWLSELDDAMILSVGPAEI